MDRLDLNLHLSSVIIIRFVAENADSFRGKPEFAAVTQFDNVKQEEKSKVRLYYSAL